MPTMVKKPKETVNKTNNEQRIDNKLDKKILVHFVNKYIKPDDCVTLIKSHNVWDNKHRINVYVTEFNENMLYDRIYIKYSFFTEFDGSKLIDETIHNQ